MGAFDWLRNVGDAALPGPTDVNVIRPHIKGLCPACGQDTLELSFTNEIICRADKCPDRVLLSDIISYGQIQHEHVVELKRKSFTIMHPLGERRDIDDMINCELQKHLSLCATPPRKPGRYIARKVEARDHSVSWEWIAIGPAGLSDTDKAE